MPDRKCVMSRSTHRSASRPCTNGEAFHQPFPSWGLLAQNLDLDLQALRGAVLRAAGGRVISYIVRSTEKEDGRHWQRGSGPNWQGGLITLCTCRHDIRAWRSCDEWRNWWIAGFTVVGGRDRGNSLVYLMRVRDAFKSHMEMWASLPEETRRAKATDSNVLGDVYRPRPGRSAAGCFAPKSYVKPHPRHPHSNPEEKWYKDVTKYMRTRVSCLLAGDPELSFLWSEPLIRLVDCPLIHHKEWPALSDLLGHLAPWDSSGEGRTRSRRD